MSMEHRAFLFDTDKYHAEIEKIIEACCGSGEVSSIKQYIDEHLEEFSSPYTWEPLEQDWEQELENGDMQEYFDFLLTACYDCEDDIGLAEAWDAVNEAIKLLDFMNGAEKCVLGTAVSFHGIVVDPGRMGLGIVDAGEIKELKEKLLENQEKLEDISIPEDLMYDMEQDEICDAYDDLCDIYKRAEKEGKGILFTF